LSRDAKEHEEDYVVVGVLEPSNTPTDRVIWIPLEGLQQMSGHDPARANDLSAVLLKLKTPIAGQTLDRLYNKEGGALTLAWPIDRIIAQLLDRISWVDEILKWVAYLVALVATGSVLASIYNSMNERRRDIAILRALGAHRVTVFATIVLEAASIASVGMLLAFGVYGIILSAVAAVIRAQTGVVLEPLQFHPVMVWAPVGMLLLSAAVGIVPALKAYRTEVAEYLAPVS
jgi:putative ABC transport system permease protein